MTNLRKVAKDRMCQIRVPGHCSHNPETTVLAHINGGGMGKKNHDLHGAWSCSACHDAVDRRVRSQYTLTELKLMHYEGMKRTQDILIEEGILKT